VIRTLSQPRTRALRSTAESATKLLTDPEQTHSLNAMAARLERANALAYDKLKGERIESKQDAADRPLDQQKPSSGPDRRTRRGRRALRTIFGLLLAAIICVAAFAWQSPYGDAAKLMIVRRVYATLPQPAFPVQTTPHDVAPIAVSMTEEMGQRFQTLTRDLAKAEQAIEQLKTSQAQMGGDRTAVADQLGASQEQMASIAQQLRAQIADNNSAIAEQLKAGQQRIASFAEQLDASREEMARIAEQLKASQEQLTRLAASEQTQQRPRTPARSQRRIAHSARKPVTILPPPQAEVQTRR